MKWLKFCAVFVLMVLAVSLAPSAVQADEPDYSNPAVMRALLESLSKTKGTAPQAYARLSPRAKEAVLNVVARSVLVKESSFDIAASEVEPDPTDTDTTASWCPSGSTLMRFRNAAIFKDPITNFEQFRMTQVAKWCFNGAWITKVNKPLKRISKISLIGWQFDGYFGDFQAGGVREWTYEDFFQGKYRFCIGGCILEQNPWLEVELRGDGTSFRDGGF